MAELKLKILVEAMERISAPFKRASASTAELRNTLKGTTETIRGLEKAQASIEAFGRLKTEAKTTAAALAAAQEKAQKLGQELAQTENGGTKKAQNAFAKARAEVNRLKDAEISVAAETATLRRRLGEAGVDTRRLSDSQRQLKRDLDAARAAATKQVQALDQLKAKTEALTKARAKLNATKEMQGKLAMGGGVAVAAGTGLLAARQPAITEAGDFQHQLAAYGLTAGQTGNKLEEVRTKIKALSVEFNQSATDVLEGQSIMVGKGLDPDKALASMGVIARAATATGAKMADMSNLAFSVMNNLKVPEDELGKAFDIMAKAGDLGGFELNNMSKYFPQLTASAQILGMTGTQAIGTMAAALQVATDGAADQSEAANNFSNFLQKATAKDTVANFEKKGIDIKAALREGLLAGENPVDIMMKNIGKAVGVDLEKEMSAAVASGMDKTAAAEMLAAKFNLSELFGDMQVTNFLAPMMGNMEKFRRVRRESMGADGVVDEKFKVMMQTYNKVIEGLGIDFKNAMESVGHAMLPALTASANALRPIIQGISAFAEANPRLTATLGGAVGAIAMLAIAGGALSLTMAGLAGPFAMVRFAMTAMTIQGGMAAGALTLLRGGFGFLASAASTVFPMLITGIRAVGLAFMANPIVAAIAIIITAVTALYTAWEPFRNLVDSIFDNIKSIFGFASKETPMAEVASKLSSVGANSKEEAESKVGAYYNTVAPPIKIAKTSMAAAAAVAAPLATTAPAAAAAPMTMGGVTIVINGAPGQSEAEIAKLVRIELEKWQARQKTDSRARLFDQEK